MKKINFYLILAIAFLLPTYLIRFTIFDIPTTVLEILIYILFILSIPQIKDIKLSKNLIIALIIFTVSGLIATIIAPSKMAALGQLKAFIIDPILLFVSVLVNVKSKEEITKIFYALFFSSIYVCLMSLYQYYYLGINENTRAIGLFGYSPNYLAFYLVPTTLIGLTLLFNKNRTILNITNLLVITLSIWTIVLSGSRAGIGALNFSIIIFFYINFVSKLTKLPKLIFTITSIILLLIAAYFFIKPDFGLDVASGGRIVSSNNVRWQIWETTINNILFKNNNWIFGIGLANFQNYFSEISKTWVNFPEWISPRALTAHNLFLHTWATTGLLGLISLIYLLITYFINTYNIKNINFKALLFFPIASTILQGIVDTTYWKNDLSAMFWLLLALSIVLRRNYEKI